MNRKINPQGKYPFFLAYHDYKHIFQHDSRKITTLREHKERRTYRLMNETQKEVIVYKIDGGLINKETVLKCDYGIYTEDDCLFLVELKGTDLNHALDQIDSTIDALLKQPKIKVKKMNVRVVLSKSNAPRIYATKEKKLKQLLKKEYGGGDYKKQSRILEDSI